MTDALKAGGLKPAPGPIEVLREETQEAMAGPLSPLTLGPALVDLAAHVAVAPAYAIEMTQAAARQGIAALSADGPAQARDDHRHIDPQGAAEANEFVVGRDVAVTPGQVVFRNELMELIQYAPATPRTRPEPLLIVPAWIMKYYILDLAPHHSLIRYLVGRGFTVFCISWRNPGAEMAQTGFDDYRRLGPMAALDVIGSICGGARIHTLGYCLGGTLLSVTAAAMARDRDGRLASFGLLAAQTDFSEPGELGIFIDETQLDQLDAIMKRQGYLDARQMAGAFNMLHARDLIWSRMIKTYLLGETEHPNDLMAWNADATRMPYRMHSHYLRALFLHNDLAEGRFGAAGGKVSLATIAAPIFVVGTEEDHVSPWRSVFKIHRLNRGDVTFLLVSGGHNGGIVSEPGHKHRSYRIGHRPRGAAAPAPEVFLATAAQHKGSWWPAYADWLDARSGPLAPNLDMGASKFPPLCPAPGTYVLAH
jgi:polyhydroxyalkanoate synthase subunit PhaC